MINVPRMMGLQLATPVNSLDVLSDDGTFVPESAHHDGMEGFRVERGLLVPLGKCAEVAVVAEGWPSRLPTLAGIGCVAADILVEKSQGRRSLAGLSSVPWAQLTEGLVRRSFGRSHVFMSGSRRFLETWLPLLPSDRVVVALEASREVCQAPGFSQLAWHSIQHSRVGGVTLDRYWIGVAPELTPRLAPTLGRYVRRVKHLFDSAADVHNMAVAAPEARDSLQCVTLPDGSLYYGGAFRRHELLAEVTGPSVYTPTKWCQRTLSAVELVRCFDLQVSLERAFSKARPATLPILGSTPVKVLCATVQDFGLKFGVRYQIDGGGLTPVAEEAPTEGWPRPEEGSGPTSGESGGPRVREVDVRASPGQGPSNGNLMKEGGKEEVEERSVDDRRSKGWGEGGSLEGSACGASEAGSARGVAEYEDPFVALDLLGAEVQIQEPDEAGTGDNRHEAVVNVVSSDGPGLGKGDDKGIGEGDRHAKATKSDDAEVPELYALMINSSICIR